MKTPHRVVKMNVPPRVIVSSVCIALFVVGFILVAIWQAGTGITDARMRGTIVSKEFQPFDQPERQITLNREGAVSTQNADGQYIITVEVPQRNGATKTFHVWIYDKQQYESLKVGDSYDVGPRLVPSK